MSPAGAAEGDPRPIRAESRAESRAAVRAGVLRTLDLTGLAVALLAAWASLSPTLLPRTWYFQGVVTGLAVVLGYGVGALAGWPVRVLARRVGPGRTERLVPARWARRVGVALVLAGAGWVGVVATREHAWTWRRLGYEPTVRPWAFLGILVLAALTAGVMLLLARLVLALWRLLHRAGRVVLPSWLAGVVAAVLVPWLLALGFNTQVYERVLDAANETFSLTDRFVDRVDQPPPRGRTVSGGPASAHTWASLGYEGREWVARTPTPTELARRVPAEHGPTLPPVRAYVGRESSDEPEERARLAVAELERLGGFARRAILVIVPTGTGWVDEQVVRPFEFLHAGDTATVATQYSHLPSPLAFLAERATAKESAAALIEAVRDRLSQIPAHRRPRLYVAGESLGAYALEGAFPNLTALAGGVDGAVVVGAPSMSTLRREAERDRRSGSPQVRPVVGDGRTVVFANRRGDLVAPGATRSPTVVFLQQPDDGVVWWDPRTAVERPDWLREPRAPEVNPAMEWRPVVTFLNLTVDMVVSNDFAEGAGHRYGTLPTDAWNAILAPGWEPDDLRLLRDDLARIQRELTW